MYISDKFVFTELHKTAGTHIGKWLSILTAGEQIGKHNIIPLEYRDRFILGSIRNPWDWYVSLWGYGCDHKGSVWQQTTERVNLRYYWQQLPKEMGRDYISPYLFIKQITADMGKPLATWREAYKDSSDPNCFKLWLKLIFSNNRKFDLREGYGFSPISVNSGILTYRFLKLFTNLGPDLYSETKIQLETEPGELWEKHKIANFFIRMENLEHDIILAMKSAGVSISLKDVSALRDASEKKTNLSSRLPANHYYDDESIKLVNDKEKLLISLFNYSPPK
jgi:hypothetical protein